MGKGVLVIPACTVKLAQLLVAKGADVVISHVHLLLLALQCLNDLVYFPQSRPELQLLYLHQSQSETHILGVRLELFRQLEPALGIGEHFLPLEEDCDVVDGDEEFGL